MGEASEWDWLRGEIAAAARRFADCLRVLDGATGVPGLDWSVGELGAHVASLPGFYLSMLDGDPFPVPDDPAEIGLNNAGLIRAVGTTDPAQLADRIVSAFDNFLERLGEDGDALVNWFVAQHPARFMAGAALGELLIHRSDLARAGAPDASISGHQARAVLQGAIPISGYYVNREVARRAVGTYRLHVRGGDDWTISVRPDGTAQVDRGRPERADLHQSADPVALLRVAYGRMSPVRAGLTFKIVAWGRKPWLAFRARNLFHVI